MDIRSTAHQATATTLVAVEQDIRDYELLSRELERIRVNSAGNELNFSHVPIGMGCTVAGVVWVDSVSVIVTRKTHFDNLTDGTHASYMLLYSTDGS